jgi:hypothetical protein
MPSRKQRRRRDKTFRHEYGFVTVDEEGNEVAIDPPRERRDRPDAGKGKGKAKAAAKPGRRGGRHDREPPLPSWRRSARRGTVWGGVMIVVIVLFFKEQSLGARLAIGLLYALLFIPLTYWIDRFAYRNWQRRGGRS